jgi:hypothetical protein
VLIALILDTPPHLPYGDSPDCGEMLARVLCNPSNPSTAEQVILSILELLEKRVAVSSSVSD